MNRRNLLKLLTGAVLFPPFFADPTPIQAQSFEPEFFSHFLREKQIVDFLWQNTVKTIQTDILIAGAGVAGLSCARTLFQKQKDFLIVDPSPIAGGTSQGGKIGKSEFPWGAHYLISPPKNAQDLIDFLLHSGVILCMENSLPVYDPTLILPEEKQARTLIGKKWTEGSGDSLPTKTREMKKFLRFTGFLCELKGNDGKPWFTLPTGDSSKDPRALELFHIPFDTYLKNAGMWNEEVEYAVNHACIDDYGLLAKEISAWCGLHYYSCRDHSFPRIVLTAPEGNFHLIKRLLKTFDPELLWLNNTLGSVQETRNGFECLIVNSQMQSKKILCKHLVFAGKSHSLPYIFRNQNLKSQRLDNHWLISNLILEKEACEKLGLYWDNIIKGSASIGMVYANHLKDQPDEPKILTHFLPLNGWIHLKSKDIFSLSLQQMQKMVISDPFLPSEYRDSIKEMQIRRLGHAMSMPPISTILPSLQEQKSPIKNLWLCNCEHYGLPLFEEAFQSGTETAKKILSN